MLHLVSHRSQRATLSLPQLYRICTELPEHTVLYRFPPFTCFIPFVPPIRCFVHVASNSGETTDPSVFGKGKFRKKSREELPPPEFGHTSQHKRVTNQKDEPITSGLLVIRPESAISSGSFFDTMVSAEFAVECRLF